jgi:hypothetical protein
MVDGTCNPLNVIISMVSDAWAIDTRDRTFAYRYISTAEVFEVYHQIFHKPCCGKNAVLLPSRIRINQPS